MQNSYEMLFLYVDVNSFAGTRTGKISGTAAQILELKGKKILVNNGNKIFSFIDGLDKVL
jgi:hypothetical protein